MCKQIKITIPTHVVDNFRVVTQARQQAVRVLPTIADHHGALWRTLQAVPQQVSSARIALRAN